MFHLNAVNPFASSQPLQVDGYVSTIQTALQKGFIKPYETSLSKSEGWSRETWLKRLQGCSEGKGKPFDLLPCYLFAVAVSEDIDTQKKEELFTTSFHKASEEELKNFYCYFSDSFPGVISAHLLRYSGQSHWEGMLKRLFKYSDMHICEKPLMTIMLEVTHNNWPPVEKQAFIDQFFERVPKDRADEVYYYMTLNASPKDLEALFAACSETVVTRLRALSEEIAQYGKTCFAALEIQREPIRIAYNDYKRLAFMVWLLSQRPEHPATDLIATDFNEKDWVRLNEKVQPKEHAFRWVCSIVGRLSRGEMKMKPDSSGHNAHIWLFLHNAMKFAEGLWSLDLKRLASISSPEFLCGYLNAFSEKVCKAIVKELLQSDPIKLSLWLSAKEREQDGYRSTASTRLEEPLRLIEKCSGIEKLFLAERDEARRVTWFAAASDASKTVMMQALFCNRDKALQVLTAWVGLSAPNSAQVKPFVREAIIGTLNKSICKQDPKAASELKSRCDGPELADFIELVIPAELDPKDPLARSKQALKQLKRHFETPKITHDDRKNFVREIYKDLKGPMERSGFVEFLFNSLPTPFWPLVFLYFEDDVCSGFFSAYTEEKMGGAMMKRTDKNAPSNLAGTLHENRMKTYLAQQIDKHEESPTGSNLQDVLTAATLATLEAAAGPSRKDAGWNDEARLVEVCATSLVHMLTTPGFIETSQANWAMTNLYQTACETNTIHKMMTRFIEMCPPEQFIPLMTEWCRSAFFHNREGLVTLVAESLEAVSINKYEFMARVIVSGLSLGQGSGGFVDFTEVFWKEPCTKTEEDRAKIARCMIAITKDRFSSLFTSWYLGPAIKSLFVTDQAFCVELYRSHMRNYKGTYKIFERFTKAFYDAGMDVFAELESPELADVNSAVKEWYRSTQAADVDSPFSWKLLHRLLPELVVAHAVQRTEKIFGDEYPLFFSFREILSILQQCGLTEEFATALFADENRIQLMKSTIVAHIDDLFADSDIHVSLPFIERIVPDWQDQLVKWTRKEMLEEQEKCRSSGRNPRYYKVKSLAGHLRISNLYNTFVQELVKDGHDALQKELEHAMKN